MNTDTQANCLRSDFDFVQADKERALKLIEDVYETLSDTTMSPADIVVYAKRMIRRRVNNLHTSIPPDIS